MYEVVQEFSTDGQPRKIGATLDKKNIAPDHLTCAIRNGWAVPVEGKQPSPRGDKPKE